jgi:hypothetical protein
LRGVDLNHRPLGYEPNELPDCSTPHFDHKQCLRHRQTFGCEAPLAATDSDVHAPVHAPTAHYAVYLDSPLSAAPNTLFPTSKKGVVL